MAKGQAIGVEKISKVFKLLSIGVSLSFIRFKGTFLLMV